MGCRRVSRDRRRSSRCCVPEIDAFWNGNDLWRLNHLRIPALGRVTISKQGTLTASFRERGWI
jgi:hypothetical protein